MELTGPILQGSHFSWEEMSRTDHRDLLAVNRAALAADARAQGALRSLTATLLEPIRDHFGPVAIHSGYRCAALNVTVGGAPNSQHMRGEAADFHVPGVSLDDVFEWVRTSSLRWGQLIREPLGAGDAGWIHLSIGPPYRSSSVSQQVLR